MEPACALTIADAVKNVLSIGSAVTLCSDGVRCVKLVSSKTPELFSEEIRPSKSDVIKTVGLVHTHE